MILEIFRAMILSGIAFTCLWTCEACLNRLASVSTWECRWIKQFVNFVLWYFFIDLQIILDLYLLYLLIYSWFDYFIIYHIITYVSILWHHDFSQAKCYKHRHLCCPRNGFWHRVRRLSKGHGAEIDGCNRWKLDLSRDLRFSKVPHLVKRKKWRTGLRIMSM